MNKENGCYTSLSSQPSCTKPELEIQVNTASAQMCTAVKNYQNPAAAQWFSPKSFRKQLLKPTLTSLLTTLHNLLQLNGKCCFTSSCHRLLVKREKSMYFNVQFRFGLSLKSPMQICCSVLDQKISGNGETLLMFQIQRLNIF